MVVTLCLDLGVSCLDLESPTQAPPDNTGHQVLCVRGTDDFLHPGIRGPLGPAVSLHHFKLVLSVKVRQAQLEQRETDERLGPAIIGDSVSFLYSLILWLGCYKIN